MRKVSMTALFYGAAILGGGDAAETFKDNHPLVGVPMFILGVVAAGVLLLMWQRANSRS